MVFSQEWGEKTTVFSSPRPAFQEHTSRETRGVTEFWEEDFTA